MNTISIKTSALIGPALDWAVAKALGIRTYIGRYEHTLTGPCILDADLVDMQTDGEQELKHSRSWEQGGPIIERELIRAIAPTMRGIDWIARIKQGLPSSMHKWFEKTGPAPLIAAMRCYVASKLGDAVQIPTELVP